MPIFDPVIFDPMIFDVGGSGPSPFFPTNGSRRARNRRKQNWAPPTLEKEPIIETATAQEEPSLQEFADKTHSLCNIANKNIERKLK